MKNTTKEDIINEVYDAFLEEDVEKNDFMFDLNQVTSKAIDTKKSIIYFNYKGYAIKMKFDIVGE